MSSIIVEHAHKSKPLIQIANNNSYQDDLVTPRKFLDPNEFESANKQKRAWLNAIIKKCGLTRSEPVLLEKIVFKTDPVYGRGRIAIGTLVEDYEETHGGYSYSGASQAIKRLVSKGAIKVVPGKRTSRNKREPNTYILEGYEYKLEVYSFETLESLNNTSLKDQRNKQTYEEYVSISSKSKEKQKKVSCETPASKMLNVQKLLSQDGEQELIRYCKAWNLDDEKIQTARKAFNERSKIKNLAGYIINMVSKMAKGLWNIIVEPFVKPKRDEERVRSLAIEELKKQGILEPQCKDYENYLDFVDEERRYASILASKERLLRMFVGVI